MSTDLPVNLLLANQARFLTVPRFAVMTWSGVLGDVLLAAGPTKVAAVSLLLYLVGIARLAWVRALPHEAARPSKADKALAEGIAQSFKPAMGQYAAWLREHYAWVDRELSCVEVTPA